MKDKISFVLFNDIKKPIKTMTDEDAGKLFKAILEYQNGGNIEFLPPHAEMAFTFIRQQMDRALEKYNEMCKKNRENVMVRWHRKDTTVYDRIRPVTKHTDSDSDSDSDSDKDKSKKDKKHKYGEFKHVLLTDKEFDKLKDKVDNREEWIKTLDEGLELKDYGYKSHYMAILKWYRKENKSKVPLDEVVNKNYAEGW